MSIFSSAVFCAACFASFFLFVFAFSTNLTFVLLWSTSRPAAQSLLSLLPSSSHSYSPYQCYVLEFFSLPFAFHQSARRILRFLPHCSVCVSTCACVWVCVFMWAVGLRTFWLWFVRGSELATRLGQCVFHAVVGCRPMPVGGWVFIYLRVLHVSVCLCVHVCEWELHSECMSFDVAVTLWPYH